VIYTRARYLPISLLTCRDATHWYAVGGDVERRCEAKTRPTMSRYEPGADSRPTVRTEATSAHRTQAAFRSRAVLRYPAIAKIEGVAYGPA